MNKNQFILIAGLFSVIVGGLFLALESSFYGTVNNAGVLQESLFLPIGWVLIGTGVLLGSMSFVMRWVRG